MRAPKVLLPKRERWTARTLVVGLAGAVACGDASRKGLGMTTALPSSLPVRKGEASQVS